tara:strand:- start:32 stop:535 length:504 start_codon:yes stop_codon:yes gene_type:complete
MSSSTTKVTPVHFVWLTSLVSLAFHYKNAHNLASLGAEVWDGSNYAVKTALVVDDMKSTSKLIAKAIELRGWKCDLAHNGSEALTIMKRQSYTVVFMDNQMPIMNGRDCVSEFRGWERGKGGSAQKNVYLMTASGLVSDEDKLLFDGVIEKPVKLADLHALLDSCCN